MKADNIKDERIKLLDLVAPLFKKRRQVLLGLMVSSVVAIVLLLLTEKKYTVEVSFIPQPDNSKSLGMNGNLGGLASLAGIDIGQSNSNTYPPMLYPKVMENIEFQLELLSAPLYFNEISDSITYRQYYDKYYKPDIWGVISANTIGLPGKVLALIRGGEKNNKNIQNGYLELSADDYLKVKKLLDQVNIQPFEDLGYVKISVTMPDKYLAAQLTSHIERKLHRELLDFKTKRLQSELAFLEERLLEKRREFENATQNLASFKDGNKNLYTEKSKVILESLQREYDLSFSVYNRLVEQTEEARLKLSNNIPLITVIKPISIPAEKSSPNSIVFLIAIIVVGFLLTTALLFRHDIFNYLKKIFS